MNKTPETAPPPSPLALRTSALAGYLFVLFLVGALLSCAWLLRKPIAWLAPDLDRDALLHGELTHHLAKQLPEAPLPQHAADLERGSRWLLMADLGPRVREGCPGWLFLTDELHVQPQAEHNARAKAQAVIRLRQALAQRGIQLLVAIVPDKSRVASTALCHLYRPASLASRVAQWRGLLEAGGVPALDLSERLTVLGKRAYLRTDSHWSEAGAQAAATFVAQAIAALEVVPSPRQAFELAQAPAAPRPGDLVRLAGIDWLPLALQPPVEQVVVSQVQALDLQPSDDDLDDLFGDSALPNVALIGTSFSHNSGFAGYLQLALGAPVGNFAKEGGEFSGAAKAYFASPAFLETPPKLLIWEIPERDLQTAFEGGLGLP
ncbi:Alginate biosynthesis protein AlgX precursor [compost metagenome]|jgi:alginate O-acetyltransferase complex protein AlgJ